MRSNYYRSRDYMERAVMARQIRVAQVRRFRRIRLLIIIGAVITMALCSFFSIKAFANTDNTKADSFGTKQYKSVMIYCGDTVESIAQDNYNALFASVDQMSEEIRSINHISYDEKLIPGNYLVIPYFDMASGY